jgi:predicted AAA+ superfamily ATPase
MLAWQSGSLVNYNMLARSLGISNHTVTAYIDFLEAAFLITRLPPFFHNVKKRLVKSPKIFIRDTGIMHRLLRLENYEQLTGNPLFGHSWETFVINQVRLVKPDVLDLFFYRTHAGAEVDLVIAKGLVPVALAEVKISADGSSRRGFRDSIETLGTTENFILVPGNEEYRQSEDVITCGIEIFLNRYLPRLGA